MLTPEERIALRRNFVRYEGRIEHMYLDSKGYVTVGVGHLLRTAGDAEKLPFRTKEGRRAGVEEIRIEYENIKALPKNNAASFYRRHASLYLSDHDIDRLTDEHIENFERELRRQYPGFDTFPSAARLALFDMIFNLGLTGLRTSWPRLNAAVRSRDWNRAAEESRRSPLIPEARNRYVKELFERAAEQTQ